MAYEFVTIGQTDGKAWVTMKRSKVNALSLELVREIRMAVQTLEADPSVRCIAITGTGSFFSAGADLPTIQGSIGEGFVEGSLLCEGLATMDAVERCTKPVVAVVNGMALGGGCELCLACHLRIAGQSAKFGQPEINIGIIPGWGGTHRLPRLIGESRATDWILTGRTVGAQEALRAGLVCKVVSNEELRDAANDLLTVLASRPPGALRAALRVIRERGLEPARGRALEAEAFEQVARSKDAAEGVAAFLEKRTPEFTGE